MKAYF
ncbi:hypothetical protein CGLO_14968 [Colletotrichum gloeosporioides Cg-14]